MPQAERNRRTRTLAERALLRLLDAAGEHWRDLVVIGGLVPDLIVESDDVHQGTSDVDVVLDVGVIYDRDEKDFSWLEAALGAAGFLPVDAAGDWNWTTEVEGAVVVLQVLVDVDDSLQLPIVLPGAPRVNAMNVRGPRPALRDAQVVSLAGRQVRVAALGSYLAAKAAAIMGRDAEKDLYDFAFVIIQAERSDPGRAARAVSAATEHDRLLLVLAACDPFASASGDGSEAYARLAAAAGVQDETEALALDAWAAVTAFRSGLTAS